MEEELKRSQHDIITIRNIDNEDFTFEYGRSEGNYPYTIKVGETARYPRFLAEHAVKHLIDKILNKQKTKTNNAIARQQLADQIVMSEDVFQRRPQLSEAERLRHEVEELNQPSDLDLVLDRVKKNAEATIPKKESEIPTDTPTPTPPQEEKFEEIEKDKLQKPKEPVQPEETPKPTPTVVSPEPTATDSDEKPEALTLPTRQQLYEYAVNTIKIELTPDTRKAFDKMSITKLVKELDYPILGD